MPRLGKHAYQLEGHICLVSVIGNKCNAGIIAPAGRRWIARWHQEHRISGVALYGASFMTGTIWMLILRAINILRRNELTMAAVADDKEAREWINQRQRLSGGR